MIKAMNISYEIGDKLYLNITNKCPCNCTFCIRHNGDGAYGSDPLWLEHQPTAEEVIDDIKKRDLDSYKEIIFCGYGEPTCELEILKETAKYIKSVTKTPIRINTNGLSDLINKRETPAEFKGLVGFVLSVTDDFVNLLTALLEGQFSLVRTFRINSPEIA